MPGATTPTTGKKQGWELNCECGFMLRDYNQRELVQLVQTHIKTTHNQNIDEKGVMGMAKPMRM